MASKKTRLTEDAAAAILRQYGLSLRGLWTLGRGTINSNYAVETDAGLLFLRVSEGKSVADAQFEADLIWHLTSHGVRTPSLWRTRSGSPYVAWSDGPRPVQPILLMNWVDGVQRSDSDLSEGEARYVGALLAQFHLSTAQFQRRRPGIYTLRNIAQRIDGMAQDPRAQTDLGPIIEELRTEAARLLPARRSDLPTGLIHQDLFPDNLIFAGRRLDAAELLRPSAGLGASRRSVQTGAWILDLEQAATLPYIFDLAVSLLAFCAPTPADLAAPVAGMPPITEGPVAEGKDCIGPLRQKQARAMVAGYQSLRALSELEQQGFYEELRFAALRFLVTRLTDLHGYGAQLSTTVADEPAEVSKLPRRLRQTAQSKHYRDFLWRMRALAVLSPEALRARLL